MADSGETIQTGTIRARVDLPCSVRLNGSELRAARGVTEELTRESVVVVISAVGGGQWLKASARVSIAVELPFSGAFEPRILECAATVQQVRTLSGGVRIVAVVERMEIVGRDEASLSEDVSTEDKVMRSSGRFAKHSSCAGERVHAVRPLDNNPAIRRNRRTNLNSQSTGEQTMSFLKNFFIEEDGQDMVEYGLVISLVVIGGVTGYKAFQTQITTALNSLGTAITGNI